MADTNERTPLLKVEHLSKEFPAESGMFAKRFSKRVVSAVNDISFEIYPGETFGLVGESGCGKSTTGRTIMRLTKPTAGKVFFQGKDVAEMSKHEIKDMRREMQFIFQDPYASLNPRMTIGEIVSEPMTIHGVGTKEERIERVRELLDVVGLNPEHINRYPHEFSGGQRQRVAIGRAIVREPKVLLMDEPLSNLDAKLRNQMRAELIKLRQRINTTFIYVTHDQTEAMTLGDRIVIMKDGVIQQIGTPQEVFNHPANLFVAGFIGMPQMNFYDAELVLEDGQYAVVLNGAKVTLPEEKQAKLKANGAAAGPITLGVRPEHLILSGDEGSMIHGTVDVSEMMGSAVHLHVSACGSDTIMIVPTTELESTSAFTIGSPIAFTFNGAMAHLFDRNTQKNLEV